MLARKIVGAGVLAMLLHCLCNLAFAADPVPEEARRYFTRGLAAVETARSSADYAAAVGEMERARELAPQWPNVYYNLGLLYQKTGNYDAAIDRLRGYLQLAPESPDAARVQETVYKLEYLRDRNNLEGVWKTAEHESAITCNPGAYRMWRSLMMGSHTVVDDLRLEFGKNREGSTVRALSSKHRYGTWLPDGPPVQVRREGDVVTFYGLTLSTCSDLVAPDHCPWQGKFELTQTSSDMLEGTVDVKGGGYILADIRTERYEWVFYQCTGKVVMRRQGR
jgi:hypothetical protein